MIYNMAQSVSEKLLELAHAGTDTMQVTLATTETLLGGKADEKNTMSIFIWLASGIVLGGMIVVAVKSMNPDPESRFEQRYQLQEDVDEVSEESEEEETQKEKKKEEKEAPSI